jgi:3-hydroxyisobutyrate dehydrogenase-like beta-hydroxyacid dehydrogenase
MDGIGIIGVGVIGKLFVDRLSEADRSIVVHDVDESQEEYAVERGASRAESPRDLVERSDAVVLALPGTPEVESTMEGDDGVTAALEAGQLVVDATTTLPETSIAVESICAERGATFVEAPITGAAPREGWQMMVGGSEESYELASDLLDDLCDDHVRIGEVGTATVFKLALQMRYAGHNAVDAEVVEFLHDNGVDPGPLNGFLGMGIWENYFTDDFGQEIEGLGGLAIWHKDIGYARRVARENGTALPINAVVHEAYKATVRGVREDEGHAAALITYWRKLNDH